VEDSKFTGPVADLGLNLSIAKINALAAALDKVDEAIKLLPTPSRVSSQCDLGWAEGTCDMLKKRGLCVGCMTYTRQRTAHIGSLSVPVSAQPTTALSPKTLLSLLLSVCLPACHPSPQIIAGAFNTLGNLWQQSHAADLLDVVDDGPIIDRLMDKVYTARDLLKKATPAVAATSGN
jgi:hypothetical protein